MTRGKWITCTCRHCGETFQASRYDAKYCSGRCRVAAHRADKARDTAWSDFVDAAANYIRPFASPESYEYALERMVRHLRNQSLV